MYEFIKSLILADNFRLDAMEKTIERHYVRDELTDEQRTELLNLAADHADDSKEVDIMAVLADLEQRIARLESAGVVVWTSGHITAKGETVLYAIVPKDPMLRYCRYDGGRASTSLRPGKIEGWVVLDGLGGNPAYRVEKDESGEIILVPIEPIES